MQKYNTTGEVAHPTTRIISYNLFKQGRKATIKSYLLELLASCDAGMTCRQIANHSDIWVQSLTSPLKELVESDQIQVIGIAKSSVSNRMVQVYGISKVKANV